MAKLKDAKLKDLVFDNKNFNKHTEFGMSLIEKSLRNNGAGRSILIDKNNRIIAGNGVTEVAGQIGLDDVQIVETDGTKIIAVKRTDIDLDTKQGREMALADNATGAADLQWDADAIADVESEFDIDASAWGVDVDFEDDAEQPTATEDDFDESTDAITTRCKKGDVWLLGEHRLMCGDSTSAEDVARLMDGGNADIYLSDPPYGISVVTNKEAMRKGVGGGGELHFHRQGIGGGRIVKGGNYSPVIGDETTETAKASYNIATEYTKDQIIFGGNYFTDFLPPKRCWIVWDKKNGENDFADFEMAWTSFDKSARLFPYLWNGLAREGSRDVEGAKRLHPTQKPVGLLVNIIEKLCPGCNTILDLFGGSGTTLIACEQLGRKCFMMELDAHYCDVIIARWEKLTGLKAEKVNDGK